MSTDVNLISSLKYLTIQINRHGALIMILFGTIGNLLNLFVLNDRSFRESPCTTYLRWSSITSILFIWSGLLTRVLEGYGINWPNQYPPLCKIRLFILMICWSVATWAFVGATMDRYLCSNSSVIRRLKSTNRTAKRFLLLFLIISIFLFVQIFYCYKASVPNVPVACYTETLACQMYNDWTNILYNILIPSIFMAIFGILTIINVRKRIIHPTQNRNTNVQPRLKKIDRNLRKILFVQILVLLVLNLPIGLQRFYANVTSYVEKSTLRVAIENFIYSIIVLIRFIAYSISFYLYFLTGSMYRETFKRKIRWITTENTSIIARSYHTASVLGNGQVLVAGGSNGIIRFNITKLFDPSSGIWMNTENMNSAQERHTVL
ncbi:hypothetical protein I4U23_011768 [Adineta vaga]|nr:hypothetical protein I4U23_011768 [Adineta vaga]